MHFGKRDGLLRHSILLMAANQVGNVSNILFQAVMGWALSLEQYGVLASMLGATLIFSTPLDAIRMSFAHYSARLAAEGRTADIKRLVLEWFKGLTGLSLLLAVLGIVFSRPLADFFQIQNRAPIIITSLMIAALPYGPVFGGCLQGVQAFRWLAVLSTGWSVIRLAVAAILVVCLPPIAEWGLLGQCVGFAGTFVIGVWSLRRILGPGPIGANMPRGVRTYFFNSLLVLAGFGVLMFADVVMVKHYFDPEQAGLFARAATIGRAVIFLPMPIAMAMFPKVASAGEMTDHSWRTLLKAMLFAVVVVAGAVLVFSLLPQVPLFLLFKDSHPTAEMIRLVRVVLWAMSPLGLVYVIMNFEMAQHRFTPAVVLLLCAAAYVGGVVVWHGALLQVVAVLATVSLLAGVSLALCLPSRGGRSRENSVQPPGP